MMDAILFDLDGTLVDTRQIYAASYRHAFAAELEVVPTFEELVALRPSSERIFLVEHWGEALGARIHGRMVEHYEANAEQMLGGYYEGVEAMLAALRDRGVRLAIVTGKSRAAYDVTARHLDLSPFDVVIAEDDVPVAKPDPAGIRAAMARMSIEATVYVGDTPIDVEAARGAGVQPAVALWARAPEDRARAAASLDAGVWALEEPSELLSLVFG